MTITKRTFLHFVVVLALTLVENVAGAQQNEPPTLTQFPTLTGRKAYQRWWWFFQQRAYPLDDIAEGASLRALSQIEQSKAVLPFTSQAVMANAWVNIGPAPILGGQIGQTGFTRPMSGRVADVAVNPTNPNYWLIGAAQGGIWKTIDSGATWAPLTDGQASLAMGAIAFAPSNPNIVYAGTGEAVFSGDAYGGAGLLKSIDGGATWTLLASSTFAKTTFSDIKVHPTNSDVVLSAVARGLSGRGADFPPAIPPLGIFKSTNGGVTWLQKLNGVATDLEVDSTNFNNQYAGLGDPFPTAANGVYRSTDAGDTWTLLTGPWSTMPGGVGRVELAIAPSDPNVLYVSIQDGFNGVGNDGGLLGLFRTSNAWAATPTWIQIPTVATDNGTGIFGYCGWNLAFGSISNQCWYDHEIIVDPTTSSTLYAGGIELWKCTNCGAAATWTEISKTASSPLNGIHVDQHTMAWAGGRLIVGNDGGVWSSADGGGSWSDHNTTLAITQFYDGSIHPTDPNFAIGGSQDNGTQKWTGSDSWQWFFGGDGADSAISSSDPNNDWAVSFQGLGIRRTTNGGATFTVADSGINKTGAPFIARFEKCPTNDEVFIAGTDNLWRSNNFFTGANPSWVSNGPEMGVGITALAFASTGACGTYAFGTSNGQLRLTNDGGVTWVNIDAASTVPNRFVTDLAFHPTNANVLYATLSGFDEGTPGQPGHVFMTTNALSPSPTWSNVSPPVNIPHNTIVLDPFNPAIVYVGTDLGVWKSNDGGVNWAHMGPETGLPNVAVFELQINHATDRVVAFTHGRGTFVNGTRPAVTIAATDSTAGESPLNTGTFTVTRTDSTASALTVFYSVSGTATSGSDYQVMSGSVTIPGGSSSAAITVTPINDVVVGEGNETVIVTLTANATYIVGAQSSATVTITDNSVADPALPIVTVVATDTTATEAGQTGTFTFTRTGPTTTSLTVSYVVTGTATPGVDYTTIPTSVTIPAGSNSATRTITPIDDATAEADETVVVTLSANPANYNVGAPNAATITIVNKLIPSISVNNVSVTEGNSGTTNAVFTVTLSAASSQTVTVNFSTANGTATAGSDYVATSGVLTFNPGQTSKTITVVVNGDMLNETNETFFVNLSNPVNAAIADGQGLGTIINDDPIPTGDLPSLSINDINVTEGNSGTTNAVFTVTLSAASSQTVTVNFSTANGTATAGSDYVATSGVLTFNPGQTSKTITVLVNGDTIFEPNETFFVNLTTASNATIADGLGVGTIDNDDESLSNISTRGRVLTGDNVMIGGFIIDGSAPLRVLVRSRGPSMGGQPFNVPGTLANPLARLFSGSTVIAQNDNWQDAPNCTGFVCEGAAAITAAGLDPCQPNPGQTGPPPNCALESAILITLPPGAYTGIVTGADGGTGVGIVEVFEAEASPLSELSNISTRGVVQSGDNVMIGGVIIEGTVPATVLIRARGPSMGGAPFNVPGTLANPFIQLFSGSTVIAQNDNWQDAPNCTGFRCGGAAQITATGSDPCQPNPGQTTSPPGCALESAILITLPPGAYTAIVNGVGGGTGVGIVEVFEID